MELICFFVKVEKTQEIFKFNLKMDIEAGKISLEFTREIDCTYINWFIFVILISIRYRKVKSVVLVLDMPDEISRQSECERTEFTDKSLYFLFCELSMSQLRGNKFDLFWKGEIHCRFFGELWWWIHLQKLSHLE